MNLSSFLYHTTITTLQLNSLFQHTTNPFPTLNHQQSTCLTSGEHLLHHHPHELYADCCTDARDSASRPARSSPPTLRSQLSTRLPRTSPVSVTVLPLLSSLVRTFHTLAPPSQDLPLTLHTEGDKSATQKLGDATRGGSDDASAQGQGIVKQAQEVVGNAAQYVADTLNTKK